MLVSVNTQRLCELWTILACTSLCMSCSIDGGEPHAQAATQPSSRVVVVEQPATVPAQAPTAPPRTSPPAVVQTPVSVAGAEHSLTVGSMSATIGARWRLGTNGLPRNTRQVEEGYWIGAQIEAEHIE